MPVNHSWDLKPKEAIALQKSLRSEVIIEKFSTPVKHIAGADISFNKFSETVYAGIVVLDYHTLEEVCRAEVIDTVSFPYIPGLLSFRETPALLKAWENLEIKPEILIMDGQGIAHPRRFGIACHFGIITGTSTIGCAKSILTGTFGHLDAQKGASAPLLDGDEQVGSALRTRTNVKPIFVSPGHKVSFEDSIEMVLHCTTKYKLPETTRKAHNMVNALRKAAFTS